MWQILMNIRAQLYNCISFPLVLPSLPLLFLRCIIGCLDIVVHCEYSHLGTRSAADSAVRILLYLMVKFFDKLCLVSVMLDLLTCISVFGPTL